MTALSFVASPDSFVARPYTQYEITDADFLFQTRRNFDNGISISINGTNPDNGQSENWSLDLAAPQNAELAVGLYPGATRFPFQDLEDPGLWFAGNGKGNNRITGSFRVLEAEYDGSGNVVRLAANFTQFGEEREDWRIDGRIRINSTVPLSVPEPASAALLLMGIAATARRRRG